MVIKMSIKFILWDLDGVVYDGRGTTYLSYGSNVPVDYFIERFESECGKEGPLKDIDATEFREYLKRWEKENRSIDSVGVLGQVLTDLRHVYGLFTSNHTKYTKNAILEGISIAEVNEIMRNVPLNKGFRETVKSFKNEGKKQLMFSNASYPIAVFFAKEYEMDYVEAIPVIVKTGNSEYIYTPDMYGRDDVKLAGKLADEKWDKLEPFKNYVKREGTLISEIAAVDDDHVHILSFVKENNGCAVGYKPWKKRTQFQELGIEIVEEDLMDFKRIVDNFHI